MGIGLWLFWMYICPLTKEYPKWPYFKEEPNHYPWAHMKYTQSFFSAVVEVIL